MARLVPHPLDDNTIAVGLTLNLREISGLVAAFDLLPSCRAYFSPADVRSRPVLNPLYVEGWCYGTKNFRVSFDIAD